MEQFCKSFVADIPSLLSVLQVLWQDGIASPALSGEHPDLYHEASLYLAVARRVLQA